MGCGEGRRSAYSCLHSRHLRLEHEPPAAPSQLRPPCPSLAMSVTSCLATRLCCLLISPISSRVLPCDGQVVECPLQPEPIPIPAASVVLEEDQTAGQGGAVRHLCDSLNLKAFDVFHPTQQSKYHSVRLDRIKHRRLCNPVRFHLLDAVQLLRLQSRLALVAVVVLLQQYRYCWPLAGSSRNMRCLRIFLVLPGCLTSTSNAPLRIRHRCRIIQGLVASSLMPVPMALPTPSRSGSPQSSTTTRQRATAQNFAGNLDGAICARSLQRPKNAEPRRGAGAGPRPSTSSRGPRRCRQVGSST